MQRTFARRPLQQRIVALIAAYAIALASLVAGLGAQAAAQPLDGGVSAICHSEPAEGFPATGPHESNGAICLKSCIGCMTAPAMVIPPAFAAAAPQNLSFKRIDLPAFALLRTNARSNAHRSRGPPPAL